MALPSNIIKEKLSRRYVEALASRAGFDISKDENDFGNDISIKEVERRLENGTKRYYTTARQVNIQLKSTTKKRIRTNNGNINYSLPTKNYNDLIYINKMSNTPKVLILFVLPNSRNQWLELKSDQLILKKCAYWFITDSKIETRNKSSIKISIPLVNVVDLDFFKFYINKYYI